MPPLLISPEIFGIERSQSFSAGSTHACIRYFIIVQMRCQAYRIKGNLFMELTRKEFLKLSAAGAAVAASGLPLQVAQSVAASAKSATPTLIKGADILTMDAKLGELTATDVLIADGKIIAIDKDIKHDNAEVVDAAGMILMPGMVDGHRHVWQTAEAGQIVKGSKLYRHYDRENNLKYGLCFTPEDMYFSCHIGGLVCLDSGVTTVLDHMHATNGNEIEDAAARGLKDSGVGGYFCYQMRQSPHYGPGDTYPLAQARADRDGPPDERHYQQAELLRDRYFSDPNGVLRFGIGLTGSVGTQSVAQAAEEFKRCRELQAAILTQHMNQTFPEPKPPVLRGIRDLHEAGLLAPDYHISHGNDVTDEELLMMKAAGSKLCSTTLGEFTYDTPSLHGRARAHGVDTGIGLDAAIAMLQDYFEHARSAFWILYKTEDGAAVANNYTSTDVLEFATISGARSLGLGDVTGSVTVGKRADLVLLRTDRMGFANLGTLADRVLNFAAMQDIDSVWAAGRAVKRNGIMAGVDWVAAQRQTAEVQQRVFSLAQTINLTE